MKPFLLKLAILLTLLMLLQVMVAFVYPFAIPAEVAQFEQYLDARVEILYFGDSTLWHPLGSQTTAQMLQEYFGDRQVGELSHAAYNLDLYAHYIQRLVTYSNTHDYHPQLVIIPINMRSFSPEWDQRPTYQFTQEKVVLDYGVTLARFFGRPVDIFGGFESTITAAEFLATTVYSNSVAVGNVADFEGALGNFQLADQENAEFIYYAEPPAEGEIENTLIYYYMQPLDPAHRKLQAMLKIVDLLQAQGTDLLFYITPVDVELGDVYLGPAFRARFSANIAVINALLAEKNVPLLDLSYELPPFYFSDTEHLQQAGKRLIAETLAAQIDPAAIQTIAQPAATPTSQSGNTPTPGLSPTAPNPLLATAMARATQAAAGRSDAVLNGTPTPPVP